MFGKSITRRPAPRTRHIEPSPPLPVRAVVLAVVATLACSYAIVRHYRRGAPPPAAREIEAPELIEVGR